MRIIKRLESKTKKNSRIEQAKKKDIENLQTDEISSITISLLK